MKYIEVADAVELSGLRLVLTAGVPGPWGESAKGVMEVKGLDYTPVRQNAGTVDPTLVTWTRQSSAPVAMYASERPRSGWAEILFLAERLAPAPALVPSDPRERAWMLGDNPSDVTAARGAQAVPFAVTPRGIGAESHLARLRGAGAVRFVEGVAELRALREA